MKALVEFLQDPSSYPEKPSTVRLVQTHISWVFVGDDYVYKVKKPVNLGFLDFSSLEKRKFYVAEELRLNARFSPDIYLAAVPISAHEERYILGDGSRVVDYALKMKRINEDRMLHRLLDAGKVTDNDMRRVGVHLARLYEMIPSDEKARSFGNLETIGHNITENFEQTRKYIGGPLCRERFEDIKSWSFTFMRKNRDLFGKRIEEGHIKECHGDLHLQHVCMEDDAIFVFDCIEFNERFRYSDVAADVAFLSMDLDYNGHGELADAFTTAYIEATGDTDLKRILIFYKVYRAYVRAKVTSFLFDDNSSPEEVRAMAMDHATRYYDLAYAYVTGTM